ncbi:C2 family cysteine protease [Legionella drozanskii]|uniref:C2 family cysteine protease n=1 Tax=Legionella drozanskii TaxID=96228 RepID=UPI00138F8270|nr:C2 family cysteine protease [Legionella drozanskii]
MPEAQRNIVIHSDNTCEVELTNPEEYLGFNIEQYQQCNEDLFGEGSPSMDDVKQFRVPDCFFLAPIAAILAQPGGASYIRSMMRQNGDGTTTVRLFHPKTLEPCYIRVQDAYIVDREGKLNNHTFWVHILEEAAASVPEFFGATVPSMSEALNGGTRFTAFSLLTGCPAKETYISHENFFAWDIAHFFADELEQLAAIPVIREADSSRADEIVTAVLLSKMKVLVNIFPEDTQTICLKLIDFYNANKEQWERIYNDKQFGNSKSRLEALINHFSIDEKNEDVVKLLRELYTYYHEMFTGIYSTEALEIFNDITSNLAAGQSLAVGTPQSYEDEVEGLRATHAYTIIETYEKPNPFKDREERIKMVRIRNPWGATGRLYLPSIDNAEKVEVIEAREAAIFDLELNEFCRFFASYTSTIGFDTVKVLAEKREILTAKMQNLLKDNDSKVEKIKAYFQCVTELVTIQMAAVELLDDEIHEEISKAFEEEPLRDQQSLMSVIEAKKLLMMNFFQTSDCDLIAASITHWWKNSKGQLSNEDERTYQHQLVESVKGGSELWTRFVENYQFNSSVVLEPLNRSLQMASYLFETISQTKEALEKLSENVDGTEQALKALFIQLALLDKHLNYLKENKDILGLWDVKIEILLEQSEELNQYVEDLLVKNSKATGFRDEVQKELQLSLDTDEFANKAEHLLVDMGLLLNQYVEENTVPTPASPQNEKLPQWVIALKGIVEQVLSIIFKWKYAPAPAQESGYNRPAEPKDDAANCGKFGIFRKVIGTSPQGSSPVPQELPADKPEDSDPTVLRQN